MDGSGKILSNFRQSYREKLADYPSLDGYNGTWEKTRGRPKYVCEVAWLRRMVAIISSRMSRWYWWWWRGFRKAEKWDQIWVCRAIKEVLCIHSKSKAVQAPADFSESEDQLSTGARQMSTWNTNAGRKATGTSRQDRWFLSERTTDEELFTWQLKARERQLPVSSLISNSNMIIQGSRDTSCDDVWC